MCNSGAQWKREIIPDHEFDFVDVRDFHSTTFGLRLRYVWVYILVIKSFMVYVSDIFTAVTMLSTDNWSNAILDEQSNEPIIPFNIARILFCLAYETRKTRKIIASRDISYAFTNVMANNYYSLRSYNHFCLFCKISDSTKTLDNFAFFIFFTFKEWKRLLLADGPRQVINGITLYSIILSKTKLEDAFDDLSKYSNNLLTTMLLATMLFSVTIFVGSVLLLLAAAICYLPLLCYIRGNLKEFCCHKVDKRITELLRKKAKERQKAQMEMDKHEALGDFSHSQGRAQGGGARLPQPTLPVVFMDEDDTSTLKEYPPMPMYTYHSGYDSGSEYEYSTRRGYGAPQAQHQPGKYAYG